MQTILNRYPRLRPYGQLMRLDRPIGTFLLLWPTLWALWIASKGLPKASLLVIFIAGVYVMRAAGCIINDYADRDFDLHVKRTQKRPLATGAASPKQALQLFVLLCSMAFMLVLCTNTMTIMLSFAGLVLAMIYPFTKRYTYMPQFFLGATWSVGILLSFTATNEQLPITAWLLYVAHILMTVAYDTAYAMVDRDDDLKIGIKSTAILFGDSDRFIIGLLQIGFIGTMILVGLEETLGGLYYLGLTLASGLLIYQQWLIRKREREQCFQAFLNNNWVGLVILVGIIADYWLA